MASEHDHQGGNGFRCHPGTQSDQGPVGRTVLRFAGRSLASLGMTDGGGHPSPRGPRDGGGRPSAGGPQQDDRAAPPRVAETDDRFYLAPSTIPGAGRGVFARVPLAPGERFEVIGVLVPADSVSDRCSAFADHHKFRIGEEVLVPLGYGGMANHSETPNLVRLIEGGRIYLEALRPIAAGEELCHRYNDGARERMGLS